MTEVGKVYVIQHATNKCYLTVGKGPRGKQYWGNYIGTEGKRYGAARLLGGEGLDKILADHPEFTAVEVDTKAGRSRRT